MTEYLRIGMITRPHGIKGMVKLEPLTLDNSRFAALTDAYVETDSTYRPVKVLSVSYSDNSVLVKLDGVNDRNSAELLRGKYICVDRAHAAPLPEGQYFITDLIGCEVYDTDGVRLGVLSDVTQLPANDVYEIKGAKGVLLVPALKKLLASVDVAAKKIVLDKDVLSEVGLFEGGEDKPS